MVKVEGWRGLWRGNMANVVRYFPTQAFNFAFKDFFKSIFPKYNMKTRFWPWFGVNMASGGLAGAGSRCDRHGTGVLRDLGHPLGVLASGLRRWEQIVLKIFQLWGSAQRRGPGGSPQSTR